MQSGTEGVYVTLRDLIRLRGQARGFTLLPRQPPGSVLVGRHASSLRGRGLNFEELRSYQDGDDVRMIDWLATARQRSPHIRVYTEERDRAVILIVDQRRSIFFGSRRAMKSVVAAKAAALAAWRVHAVGDRIAAVVFNDETANLIAPSRGLASVERVLGEIARMSGALSAGGGASNAAMLNQALDRAARIIKHDGLVVILSDGYGADEQTRRLVTGLSQHNDVVAAFIRDPLEEQLPAIGKVVLAEGEQRLSVDTGTARLRDDYARSFAERRDQVAAFGRHRAIPVLPLRTALDVASQIRAALAPRVRRG
jgi:uncharacterized protein (DUF58 family)